jgi:hypothetical protein
MHGESMKKDAFGRLFLCVELGLDLCDGLTQNRIVLQLVTHDRKGMQNGSVRTATHLKANLRKGGIG